METTARPIRTKNGWKPRVSNADLVFLKESNFTALLLDGHAPGYYEDDGARSSIFVPPYVAASDEKHAAISRRDRCVFCSDSGIRLQPEIIGGYDAPAIRVSFTMDSNGNPPLWIALKTFTGIQVKYLRPDDCSPVTFALADDDAYCYCAKNPCEECAFQCKNGYILYAASFDGRIARHPLKPEVS